jgi:pimeloyl-ACP methyl ester carboxylesterase
VSAFHEGAQPLYRPEEGVLASVTGAPIVYQIHGEDGPVLCCSNGVGVSTFFWEPFAREMGREYRVVLWDYPGHGRSGDPDHPEVTLEQLAEDELSVLTAVRADRAVLLGHSLGAQVNFELYRRHPERVLGLVPTLGGFGRAVEGFFGSPRLSLPLAAAARAILPRGHRVIPPLLNPLAKSRLLERGARLLHIVDPQAPDMRDYFEHLVRVDYRVFASLLKAAQDQDAYDLLPRVRVPTLVIGAEKDYFVPPKISRRMAEAIPEAELFMLAGASHAGLFEQEPLFRARVRDFLARRVFGDLAVPGDAARRHEIA